MRLFGVLGGCLLMAGVALAEGEEGLPLDMVRPTPEAAASETPRDEVSAREREALIRVAQGEASLAETPELIELLREVVAGSPPNVMQIVLERPASAAPYCASPAEEAQRPELTRLAAARLVGRLLECEGAGPEAELLSDLRTLRRHVREVGIVLAAAHERRAKYPKMSEAFDRLRMRKEQELRAHAVHVFERYTAATAAAPQVGMADRLPGTP